MIGNKNLICLFKKIQDTLADHVVDVSHHRLIIFFIRYFCRIDFYSRRNYPLTVRQNDQIRITDIISKIDHARKQCRIFVDHPAHPLLDQAAVVPEFECFAIFGMDGDKIIRLLKKERGNPILVDRKPSMVRILLRLLLRRNADLLQVQADDFQGGRFRIAFRGAVNLPPF